jgi:hypothetical protein
MELPPALPLLSWRTAHRCVFASLAATRAQVEDAFDAVTQLAQTTMRSELGKLTLDKTFEERESLNHNIVKAINDAASVWGVRCLRYEIRTFLLLIYPHYFSACMRVDVGPRQPHARRDSDSGFPRVREPLQVTLLLP